CTARDRARRGHARPPRPLFGRQSDGEPATSMAHARGPVTSCARLDLENPLPRACVGLVALLPGVAACGRRLAGLVTADRSVAKALAPAFALAAWVAAIHVTSYA